jgi:hypothetical protein
MLDPIEALLCPRSIAVLGASADFRKLNDRALKALIDGRYADALYPVSGKPAVNRDALVQAISAVSAFGAAAGPRLGELDLNSVLCSADSVVPWTG